jgi:hypothetical protein
MKKLCVLTCALMISAPLMAQSGNKPARENEKRNERVAGRDTSNIKLKKTEEAAPAREADKPQNNRRRQHTKNINEPAKR